MYANQIEACKCNLCMILQIAHGIDLENVNLYTYSITWYHITYIIDPANKGELVKGMGILVNGAMLATALRRAKRQPTRLLRYLMVELFSHDELRCSTVRGKKGKLPALDPDIMNAILCKLNWIHDICYLLSSTCTFRLYNGQGGGVGSTSDWRGSRSTSKRKVLSV